MRRLLHALCLFLAGSALPLAAEQLPLKGYTTAEGLASDRVRCLLPDSHGFLWLGTVDGISRFDGYGFTNFGSSDGLPGLSVRAIVEAQDGTYWAATERGLAHWDPARAPGHPVIAVVHVAPEGGSDSVRCLFEDRAGGLWAGTPRGVYNLEKSGGDWKSKLILSAEIFALVEDRGGSLWIGAEEGLFRRSPNGSIERVSDGIRPLRVRCLLEARDGTLWVGQYRGITRIHPASDGGPLAIEPVLLYEQTLAGSHVTSLLQTSDGKIWAGRFGGLSEIAADGSTLRSYTTADGLSGTGIWSLGEDRDRNLWIGMDNSGVMRLARDGFRRFENADGLHSTRIGELFEDRDGRPCAFTRGTRPEEISVDASYLECFDGRRFVGVRPNIAPDFSFGWGLSQLTLQDEKREWWIPTANGLHRFPAVPLARLARTAARRIYTVRDGLPSDFVFRLFEDSRGDLWLALLNTERPLARWDRKRDSFRVYSAAEGAPSDEPRSFAEDRAGNVWIGYSSAGLARYRRGTLTFFREADGAPSGGIEALLVDARGRLWIASGRDGVRRIERPHEEERPQFIPSPEGLSSRSVASLVEDGAGRIYAGTEHGLDRISPEDGNVQHFTTDDGLARGVVETALRDRKGNLWFGSTGGLSLLAPGPEAPRPPLHVRIVRILAGGVRQALPEIGAVRVELPELGAQSATVQFDFVAINFAPGGNPRYQYRLEGLDRDWSQPSEQRSVVYARLPPFHYRFRVRALANDGTLGPEPAEATFRVLPPLWRHPAFLASAALVLAGLAVAFHRSRVKTAIEVERIRARVATDLHDDVGAGLSEIAILSEVARRRGGGDPPGAVLEEIADSARRLVDAMSDIVWSTDPRKDDVSSLVQRIRRFAANVLESQGIRFTLDVPQRFEAEGLAPERRKQIFLIVKEALANAARHAGSKSVSLRITPDAGAVEIEIEDDGRGFAPPRADEASGQGLASMAARAASLGGELRVNSRPGGGTRVVLRIPRAGRRAGLSA